MIYLELFWSFFKTGLFTFGGGYAMIPVVRHEVTVHGWMSEEMFYNFIGVCESTPGPIAINMATYVGSTQGGFLGALLATLGVVLPSFIIILLIAKFLHNFKDNKYVKAFLDGVKPVVMALIASTGIMLIIKCLIVNFSTLNVNNFEFDLYAFIITIVLVSIMIYYKKIKKNNISPILLIIISAVFGILFYGF